MLDRLVSKAVRLGIFSRISLAIVVTSCVVIFLAGNRPALAADSCTPPATTYGSDTVTVTIPLTTTYTIWTRLQAPTGSTSTVLLDVDGTTCYNVGGAAEPASTWNWINYSDADTSSTIQLSLSEGNHSFEFIGTSPSVEIDRIEALNDSTCTPLGTGDNCIPAELTGVATPVYRMFNPKLDQHFFTADEDARAYVKLFDGYNDDGIAFNTSASQQSGMIPIYTMYNGGVNDHWLTVGGAAGYWAVNYGGYEDNGVAFYAYPVQPLATTVSEACQSDSVPVYALWNGGLHDHFYTINSSDRYWLINFDGYTDDTSASYIDSNGNGAIVFCVPSDFN